nr:glycosyltransferase family 4 protein [Pseudoalteromonas sp. WY3]
MGIRKRIFIATEYISLNHNSTAFYWAKIALYLNKHYELTVICPQNSYTESFFHESKLNVCYINDLALDKNKLVSRVFGQLRYAWSFNRYILKLTTKNDIVFTGTNPIISMFFTALLKKAKAFKWMMLCHDIFPDNLIPAGIMTNGIKYKVLKKVFSLLYKSPDTVIPIGRDMALKLQEKGVLNEKLHVISNWADHQNISLVPKVENPIIKELGWQNNIVFCFFGNHGRVQGLSNLLRAIPIVKSDNARFLFIGGGADEQTVIDFVALPENNNSFYFGELPLLENNIGLNCGDVALVPLSEGMYGLGVPSKAYFSMAADKPILLIADEGCELDLLIKEYNLGWFCKGGDTQKLASTIDEICKTWGTVGELIQPREVLIKNFCENRSLLQFKNLANKLFQK